LSTVYSRELGVGKDTGAAAAAVSYGTQILHLTVNHSRRRLNLSMEDGVSGPGHITYNS
jgi:hypothetical protein